MVGLSIGVVGCYIVWVDIGLIALFTLILCLKALGFKVALPTVSWAIVLLVFVVCLLDYYMLVLRLRV